jgi:hypothetical protein
MGAALTSEVLYGDKSIKIVYFQNGVSYEKGQ